MESDVSLFSTTHRVLSLYLRSIEKSGQYYKGFIDGEDNYNNFLKEFSACCSNSFIVRKSVEKPGQLGEKCPNKENSMNEESKDVFNDNDIESDDKKEKKQRRLNETEGDIVWKSTRGHTPIDFFGIPFKVVANIQYECSYGQQRYKSTSTDFEGINNHPSHKKRRIRIQDSRKLGCSAKIYVRKIVMYPEYNVAEKSKNESRHQFERNTKKETLTNLRKHLKDPNLVTATRYYVCVPDQCAHTSHALGAISGLGLPLDQRIIEQISKLSKSGVSDVRTMRDLLKSYVFDEIFKDTTTKPDRMNTAFFPTDKCIANHMYIATVKQKLSCMDQKNLQQQISEWKREDSNRKFFFRPCKIVDGGEDNLPNDILKSDDKIYKDFDPHKVKSQQFTQKLLYVHQEKWQQSLLNQYGNNVTLMDATYKTTKYVLPLFFIIVNTNCGYKVAGEFIIQEENTESVHEALSILREWNPSWHPKFFMCDYSEVEINAVEWAFEGSTEVLLCAFHREQAWERWTKRKESNLTNEERQELLMHLRRIANAEPTTEGDIAGNYDQAVRDMKSSVLWQSKPNIQKYIEQWWLSCSNRWARAFRENNLERNINTNNGAESLNKLLKYKFLKQSSTRSLCGLTTLLNEEFLPYIYRTYLAKNAKSLNVNGIRSYGKSIPQYLHGRPRFLIEHCLSRMQNSETDYEDGSSITLIDSENKVFQVKSSTRKEIYTCDLLRPICDCWDWRRNKLPCKHMFLIFHHIPNADWYDLPQHYLNQEHLKIDKSVLDEGSLNPKQQEIREADFDCSIANELIENDNTDDKNIACDEDLPEFKSKSLKVLRRDCISKIETLKNKIHESKSKESLSLVDAHLNKLISEIDKTLIKDEGESIALSQTEPQYFKPRKVKLKETESSSNRKNEILHPLATRGSRKRNLEHWKSRGRVGKRAQTFRDSKQCNLTDDTRNRDGNVETCIITEEITCTKEFENTTDSMTKQENKGKVVEDQIQRKTVQYESQKIDNSSTQTSTSHSFLPHWGGRIQSNGRIIKFVNTCPVDNWLLFFQTIALADLKAYVNIANCLSNERMENVLRLVKLFRFADAKLELARLNDMDPITGNLDFYGNENDLFIRHLSACFSHNVESVCSSTKCPQRFISKHFNAIPRLPGNRSFARQDVIDFLNEWILGTSTSRCSRRICNVSELHSDAFKDEIVDAETGKTHERYYCNGERLHKQKTFSTNTAPILLPVCIDLPSKNGNLDFVDLPECFQLRNKERYRLVGVSLWDKGKAHYTAMLNYKNVWYFFDGLKKDLERQNCPPKPYKASHCLYVMF